MTKKDLDFV
jgi:serine/threonine protein kinase